MPSLLHCPGAISTLVGIFTSLCSGTRDAAPAEGTASGPKGSSETSGTLQKEPSGCTGAAEKGPGGQSGSAEKELVLLAILNLSIGNDG